ncbi:putative late blight resistance protein-like protein R1A-4 [Forsythia ovata]|uniref:Late blight resistance protein-like protein R1A-4 n=1 Tax=Forsythia ovata TaxID=205694 RepID=A0ABD1TUP5_9LAMI
MEGEILRCSPNLCKLKCFLEEFQDLSFLHRLESLRLTFPIKYVTHLISFPLNLRKLTLVRVFMSREGAKIIGRLPNLVVLKLQNCSFEGNQWNTTEGEFQQLKVLKLSSVRDREWNASCDPFPRLEQLVLENCNLEKIPSNFCDIPTLKMIGVHYCKQSVVESAMQIEEEQRDMGNEELQVIISSYT